MSKPIKITEGFYYLGGSDRRIALFENVYPLSNGASYNSYLYVDEKTCLLDTVDVAIEDAFYERLEAALDGRSLDYLIVNHMEPDHAAGINGLLLRHPETTVYVSMMGQRFLLNYFPELKANVKPVKEGDTLSIGKHEFTFIAAPFVHWPEVLFTYERSGKTLFSADAFGSFGALNGDIYESPWNFDIAEARRYYANIVGKYGDQVKAALGKVSKFEVDLLCPLHGPLHKKEDLPRLLDYYGKWANYESEANGVMIVYGSSYGHTAQAAEELAILLAEKGVRDLVLYDVSKSEPSFLIGEAFRCKAIILASTTYNSGVFVKMEDFLHDLAAHAIRNKVFGFIENGSWAPASKAGMLKILETTKGNTFLTHSLTLASSLKKAQEKDLEEMAEEIVSILA